MMKTLFRKIKLLAFIFIWPGIMCAQTITTTPGSVTSCPGEIAVPINVTYCNGIGAISLILNYNNAVITYLGYQNVNGALSTGYLVVNTSGSKVMISWASSTPADIGNDTLVELRFTGVPGTSNLNWDTQTPGNCEYSDTSGTVLTTTFVNGTVTINQPPLINIQPADKISLVGQNTSFSLSASGTGLAYRWQLSTDGGGSWADISNNSIYSGSTTATLSITNVLLTYNGYKYRCRITGTCTPVVYSNLATLTVINPVTTLLPTANFCPGNIIVPVTATNFTSVASFSLTFSYNNSALTYTGYQNLNSALSGGNFVANATGGKVYMSWTTTEPAGFGDGTVVEILFSASTSATALTWDTQTNGNCEYINLDGNQITSVFVNGSLTLYGLPAIVTQPSNSVIAKGQNTTFGITASGSGLTYLWQVSTDNGDSWSDLSNGGTYSTVTTATMHITSAQLSLNAFQYRCKVSGTCLPVAYSNPALLTVLPNIITTCQTVSGCPGQFIIPVRVTDFIGVASFSLALTADPQVLTYTGYQDLNPALAEGMISAGSSAGKVYFSWSDITAATIANGDTLFNFLFNGFPGSCSINWDTQTPGNCEYTNLDGLVIFSTWNNGGVTVYQPPVISAHPANQTIYAGGSTTFSTSATGTGLGYLWQVSDDDGAHWSGLTNGSPYSGVSTSTLTINPASLSLNGYLYRCHVAGTCLPDLSSNSARLTVIHAAITTIASSISNSCTGNLNVPVMVTNCTDVGSISLALQFDTLKLSFDCYHSAHPDLSSGLLIVNKSGNKVILTWASVIPANIASDTLIQFKFTSIAGVSSTLAWDTQTYGNCEYSDADGAVITSFYANATVSTSANALIVNAGNDQTIFPGGSVALQGSGTGGVPPYTYLWTPSTGLSDPSLPNPIAWPAATSIYTLTITDVNNCSGSDQSTVFVSSGGKNLFLKVFLEGYFDTPSGLMNKAQDVDEEYNQFDKWPLAHADTISVLMVRDWGPEWPEPIPYDYEAHGLFIDTDGSVSVLNIPGILSGSYYIIVNQRQTIQTWSAEPVPFTGNTIVYDFTDSADKAFGGNQKRFSETGSVYGLFSGDITSMFGTQDGYIDIFDNNEIFNNAQNGSFSYMAVDLTGINPVTNGTGPDGFVDIFDMVLVFNNMQSGIGMNIPPYPLKKSIPTGKEKYK